jgi:hypothetical protein
MSVLEAYGFTGISAADKELFSTYYEKMNDNWASSICFASMIAWNKSIILYHRILGDYLCCLAYDTTCSRWVTLPLLGHYETEKMDMCIKELLGILEALKLPLIFTDVSEWMLPYYWKLKSVKLKETYDIGLSDYIYTAEDFVKGLNRSYCRYDYNYFIKRNNPRLVEMKQEDVDTYMDFLKKVWCNVHECDFCKYGCLLDSAKSLIGITQEVGAKGITVYVKDEIVGYAIVTMERDELVFHFKKGIHGIRGLSEFLHRSCYELYGADARTINYTEDMNIEGLRIYKQKLALQYSLKHKYELYGA